MPDTTEITTTQHRHFLENVFDHLLHISRGECTISDDLVSQCSDEAERNVLAGLQMLHEDLKLYKTELRQSMEAEYQLRVLQERNKELEQFSYVASHDLQEPLRTIQNFAGLLETQYYDRLDEQGQIYLNFIRQSSRRMSELILGLLHYSRVGQEAEQKVISTQQMLKAVLIDLHALIVRYQVKIRIAKLPSIKANPVALRQVFQHLLENAIKFQRPGASIEVQVSCQQVDGFHQFCIEDNGIGIPKAYQEKIFLIFQQLHQKNEYDGNGMGLALCKKIIEMHKGKIWLQSEPNAGTKFYFSLPA